MTYISPRQRVFPMRLASHYSYYYSYHLHWLRYLIERLGREATLEIWGYTFQEQEDEMLARILSAEWVAIPEAEHVDIAAATPYRTQIEKEDSAPQEEIVDMVKQRQTSLTRIFPFPIEGLSAEEAHQIIEKSRPFLQINQRFPNLNVMREITAYEAIHLFNHGIARLVEYMIDKHGKRGELIAYDAMLADIAASQTQTMSVTEFMKKRLTTIQDVSQEPDIYSAGLKRELLRASEKEVVWLVKECEWARYYGEHHPRVGYLLACSTDSALYGSFNKNIRFQHNSTIMEGDEVCTYRLYTIGDPTE